MTPDDIARMVANTEDPDRLDTPTEKLLAAHVLALADEVRRQQARIQELEKALRTIQQWNCLNPPEPDMLLDLPWLGRFVNAALKGEEPK